jgi:aspartyl-tRNA synthetase
MHAQVGDTIFFGAADRETVDKALGAVRRSLGSLLNLCDENVLALCRVIDFPMFEKTETGGWTFTHNPFSAPCVNDIPKLMA